MENLHDDIILNIISRLDARDIAMVSKACPTWRLASKNLRRLSINVKEWSGYNTEKNVRECLNSIPRKGLEYLSVCLSPSLEFDISTIASWVSTSEDTLIELHCAIKPSNSSKVDFLESCARKNLEVLSLRYTDIGGTFPQVFSRLKKLSLRDLCITASYLSFFVSSCPRLEKLSLKNVQIMELLPDQTDFELCNNSLQEIVIDKLRSVPYETTLILKADRIETIQIKDCNFMTFKHIGKGTLQFFVIENVHVEHIDIGDKGGNLEAVICSECLTSWPEFFRGIYMSHKLMKLKIWNMATMDRDDEIVVLEELGIAFPFLTELSLSIVDFNDSVFEKAFDGSFNLKNVIKLEIGWCTINEFFGISLKRMLENCINVRKVYVHGPASRDKADSQIFIENLRLIIEDLKEVYTSVDIEYTLEDEDEV